MENKILQFIFDNQLLIAGDRILIGVSGGADSLALLHFLKVHAPKLNIEIGAAHLHHGLRGKDADYDLEQVKKFCQKYGIFFYSKKVDVQHLAKDQKMSFEDAGRKARYDFFKEIQRSEAYNKLALGHHLNDQAETVLMRLVRGTGIKGASGILPITKNPLCTIRPFLCITKTEIIDYCEQFSLEFCTDASNFETDVTRNKLRLEVLPGLKEINPKVETHFYDFALLSREYEDFFQDSITQLADVLINKKNNRVYLNLKGWIKQKPLVQKELLRQLFLNVKGSLKEIEYNHILCVQKLLLSKNTSWEYHLPEKLMLYRQYDDVWSEVARSSQKAKIFGRYPLFPNKDFFFSNEGFYIKLSLVSVNVAKKIKELKNHSEKYFDYGKIRGQLYLRSRQNGDFFYPVGLKGRKKLKDYYIDRKIEKEKRDQIPLIALESEIIWILGYAINRAYQINENTTEVLRVEYKRIGESFESGFEKNSD